MLSLCEGGTCTYLQQIPVEWGWKGVLHPIVGASRNSAKATGPSNGEPVLEDDTISQQLNVLK